MQPDRSWAVRAIVADRGQVTIPKALRDRLGIGPKTVLEFKEENGRLIAEKAQQTDPVAEVMGCLKLDMSTDEILSELRGGLAPRIAQPNTRHRNRTYALTRVSRDP